jgi:hypothetical protein
MMPFTDWTGLSGLALVWLLLALRLPVASRLARPRLYLFVAGAYCAVMLPVFGLSLAGWLRGMVGDLSVTSVLLLATALYTRLRQLTGDADHAVWDARDRYGLLFFLSVVALLLYPFALGIGVLDPYRSGFGGVGPILALALLALWAMRRNLRLLPLALALAALAWSLGWYESTNLWDYLVDAPLAIYALAATAKLLLLNARRGKRA